MLSGDDWRMSNYIDNLATRTLDPTVTIQPRLPSLFEPSDRDADFTAAFVERAADAEVPLPVSNSPHSAHSSQTDVDYADGARSVSEKPSHQELPPAIALANPEKTPKSVSGQFSSRLLQHSQKGDQRIGDTKATSENFVSTQRRPAKPPLTSQAMPTQVAPPLAKVPVQLRTAPHSKPVQAVIESAPATVKVTIGRIDVRAIMPPTPAPLAVARQRSSIQSLEEYLKQRSRNGR
jgi:hypothetical protein